MIYTKNNGNNLAKLIKRKFFCLQFVQYGPSRGQQPESAAWSTGTLPIDMEQSLASYDFCDLILKQARPAKGIISSSSFYYIRILINSCIAQLRSYDCNTILLF